MISAFPRAASPPGTSRASGALDRGRQPYQRDDEAYTADDRVRDARVESLRAHREICRRLAQSRRDDISHRLGDHPGERCEHHARPQSTLGDRLDAARHTHLGER
jgi:hypothetical protein